MLFLTIAIALGIVLAPLLRRLWRLLAPVFSLIGYLVMFFALIVFFHVLLPQLPDFSTTDWQIVTGFVIAVVIGILIVRPRNRQGQTQPPSVTNVSPMIRRRR